MTKTKSSLLECKELFQDKELFKPIQRIEFQKAHGYTESYIILG